MTTPIGFTSTSGTIAPVSFDEAVLRGFAPDGGLFVPDRLPKFTTDDLKAMQDMSYPDLCCRVLSEFIHPEIIPGPDLHRLIRESFKGFSHPDILPLVPCPDQENLYIMELFHGPTLSFKDIAMGFLIRAMDYLLLKKDRRLNLILATTGDTGPAAAHAAAGLSTIHCWPLFPKGMITPEQEGQMTGIRAANIHPTGVTNCPDGGDDLDRVVLALFGDPERKDRLNLSSVNSINWCRVMVQSVHYIYAYLQVCRQKGQSIGDPISFSVPSGAFGNLFAGYLAREMGLPVETFICSVNANQTLFKAFTQGIFEPAGLISTCSSAIDIVLPYNFWRFLYFATGRQPEKIRTWMEQLADKGKFELDVEDRKAINKGFRVVSVSDALTLETIRDLYGSDSPYLIDPHGAVALAGAKAEAPQNGTHAPVVCLATAHPAKFPDVIARALETDLPDTARHPNLKAVADANLSVCALDELETHLVRTIETAGTQPHDNEYPYRHPRRTHWQTIPGSTPLR
ncbi:MAG: threonine synthase, partial [Desulfobacterales bacterium]|nr:threonine synthase [Desulfobacterales bacterium]